MHWTFQYPIPVNFIVWKMHKADTEICKQCKLGGLMQECNNMWTPETKVSQTSGATRQYSWQTSIMHTKLIRI